MLLDRASTVLLDRASTVSLDVGKIHVTGQGNLYSVTV